MTVFLNSSGKICFKKTFTSVDEKGMRPEMVEVEENSLVTIIHAQVHHNVRLASIRDWDTP